MFDTKSEIRPTFLGTNAANFIEMALTRSK